MSIGLAGTSKERAKLKGKLRSDDQQVRDSVVQYNELAAFGCSDRAALLAEKVLSDVPEFPWAGEAATGVPLQLD